ncbi:hypothetical protein [Spirosoma arcticum]
MKNQPTKPGNLMKYVLLFVIMVPDLSRGQSKIAGLGQYTIGITTPDLLNRTAFREEEQSYVKGTIALPCAHIRTFTASTLMIAGVSVTNIVLVFYDDTLFNLSCDYSAQLKAAFVEQHGPGVRKPVSRFQFCPQGNDTPMLVWGERWLSVDILALVVYWKGYTTECKPEEGTRLVIADQRISALSSDCDLKPADSFIDAFIKSP